MAIVALAGIIVLIPEETDASTVSSLSDLCSELESDGESIVVITSDIEVDCVVKVNGTKTITSDNGSSIIRSATYGKGIMLDINKNATLTLSGNLVIDGNKDWITNNRSDSLIQNNGILTITNDVRIQNNSYVYSDSLGLYKPTGSAITNYGKLTMSGGTISNNDGGSVVYVENGSFLISGGSISNNASRAVAIEHGSMDMTGGTISNNTSGIMVTGSVFSNATFNMSDGMISENGTENIRGGGILLDYNGKFIMTGGTIQNNKSGGFNGRGGGIFVSDNAHASLSGGIVTKNESLQGAGIYVAGTCLINGTEISNNNYQGIFINQGSVTMRNGIIDSNTVCISGGNFTITGGSVLHTPGAITIAGMWTSLFEFGGTARFDSESFVSVRIKLVEGTTQVISDHAITVKPTYTEGLPWITGNPPGLVNLNHSKIDVLPYNGEKWTIDGDGRLLNTHLPVPDNHDREGEDDDHTTITIAIVAVIILAIVTIMILKRGGRGL